MAKLVRKRKSLAVKVLARVYSRIEFCTVSDNECVDRVWKIVNLFVPNPVRRQYLSQVNRRDPHLAFGENPLSHLAHELISDNRHLDERGRVTCFRVICRRLYKSSDRTASNGPNVTS